MSDIQHQQKLADIIRRGYQAEIDKDIDTWAAMWADDSRVTFPFDVVPGQRDVVGKDVIVEWTAKKFTERARTELDLEVTALADGKRVLSRFTVNLYFVNGTTISGPILCIYTFDENDKVVLMEEFVNDATWPANYKDLAVAAESN